ncbi:MAG: site-specific DNA-methyltransferase, partial [Candidatus Krumholzibacteria bacterium]
MSSFSADGIYRADCVKALSALEAGSVDLVFADPPFNIGYDYDEYHDRKENTTYLNWTREWMRGVVEALKPDGTFWLAIGDEYAADLKIIAEREIGFVTRSWVIWYYTFGVNCKRKFNRSHAHLFHFVKDPKQFTFNAAEIKVPSARQLVYADRRANPSGRLPDDTWILRPQDLPHGFEANQDTWYFPRVCGTFKQRAGWHGCQMPERLLDRVIRTSSCPGDVVLDPFAGTGTTLAVAKKLHRRWLGFEISKQYVKEINDRLSRIKPGDPADGGKDPLSSAPRTPPARGTNGEKVGRPRVRATLHGKRREPAPFSDDVSKTCAKIVSGNGEFSTALVHAFIGSSDGYSIDRMLADPKIGVRFRDTCRELGIPGTEASWSLQLLALRKAGRLRGMPRRRRTSIPQDKLDQFIFASEIAWQLLGEKHEKTLDDILCNPQLAKKFDSIAGRFAPDWSPFHYRWGALTLRKKAKDKRTCAENLPEPLTRKKFSKPSLSIDRISDAPSVEGLYLLKAGDQSLYLGETETLKPRLERLCLDNEGFSELLKEREVDLSDVKIALLPLPGINKTTREGIQFL